MELRLHINGSYRAAEDGRSFPKQDPFNDKLLCEVPAASIKDAREAVAAAASAFPAWAARRPADRRAVLFRAAELLAERASVLGGLVAQEIGAPKPWGDFNCRLGAGMLQEAGALAYSATGTVIPSDVPGSLSLAVRQPAGVVLAIAPWNAPIILSVRAIAVPIVCGNSVVLKASELAPQAQYALADIFAEAGLPAGVLNIISTDRENAAAVTAAMIAEPAVRRVNFTGSTGVGRAIAMQAAEHLTPTLLELGGKAPFIVLPDADVDEAVRAANFGAFMNQGQICMATDRIIVHRSVEEAFVRGLAERAKALRAGDPTHADSQVGCLISADAVERMNRLVADAVSKGAVLHCGGSANGAVFEPTVLSGMTPEMALYSEEIFGPIAAIITFDDEAEAIRVANDTAYGLSAAVFGRDVDRCLRIAQQIETGICHINGATVHDEPQVPFGGVKDSGWGRFGGQAGIESCTELRWMTVQAGHRHYPI